MGNPKGIKTSKVWAKLFGFKVGDRVEIYVPSRDKSLFNYHEMNGKIGTVELVGHLRTYEYCAIAVEGERMGTISSHFIVLSKHLRKIDGKKRNSKS